MFLISDKRFNPKKQCDDYYYRIKESYRTVTGKVKNYILLHIGFMDPSPCPEDIRDIGKCLTFFMENGTEDDPSGNPIKGFNQIVQTKAKELWNALIDNGAIDRLAEIKKKDLKEAENLIDLDTIEQTVVCESGAEWACLQSIRELQIDKFLEEKGWNKNKIDTTLSYLITRIVYNPSELKLMRIMDENSSVSGLVTGDPTWRPEYHDLYDVVIDLYKLKDEFEDFLCRRTESLFNISDKLNFLYLTKFDYENPKSNSKSRKKRKDTKLLVLVACINQEGFIVLKGNISASDSLSEMIETIRFTVDENNKTIVVIDADIATDDNLKLIKGAGCHYLCVSRNRLTGYILTDDAKTVTVLDSKKQEIILREVKRYEGGDCYLEITSTVKEFNECSMNQLFKERFEETLNAIKCSLFKKRGQKNYEKVLLRIGRAIEKYPSIAKFYEFTYTRSDVNPENMADFTWIIKESAEINKRSGIYFLRTDIAELGEKQTWDYYNIIREIISINQQLKLNLNLRPIYRQTDVRADANLFLGMLSCWIVNTIRYKLKQRGIMHNWLELVSILSAQKIITTEAFNLLGKKIKFLRCSNSNPEVAQILDTLSSKY